MCSCARYECGVVMGFNPVDYSYETFFSILEMPEEQRSIELFIDVIDNAVRNNGQVSKDERMVTAFRRWKQSHSLAHGLKFVTQLENRPFQITGNLAAAVRLTLAYQGDTGSASMVAEILACQADLRPGLNQEQRDAMLVHALGFFAIASAISTPNAMSAADGSYQWPKLYGHNLLLRLRSFPRATLNLALADAVDTHKPIGTGKRYTEQHEVTNYSGVDGRQFPAKLRMMEFDSAYEYGVTNPLLMISLAGKRISEYFPYIREWGDALADKPHDPYLIMQVVNELRELERKGFDTREEQEGLSFLAAELGHKPALIESAMYAAIRGYHSGNGDLLQHALCVLLLAAGAYEISPPVAFENPSRYALSAVFYEVNKLIEVKKSKPNNDADQDDEDQDDDVLGDGSDDVVDTVAEMVRDELGEDAVSREEVAEYVAQHAAEKAKVASSVITPDEPKLPPLHLRVQPELVQAVIQIGNRDSSRHDQIALKSFEKLMTPILPRPMPSDLGKWRAALIDEFPHCVNAIDCIVDDLQRRRHALKRGFLIKPTLLVGAAGTGKSRFARRVGESAGLAVRLVPCGGAMDGHFGGVSRGWSSGMPSVPASTMRDATTVNPFIVMDEVEKIGTGHHNGNMHDVLLGMLESETARCWVDPYIQGGLNLSHVNWLFTANSLEGLPTPFRDRLRIIHIDRPTLAHLPQLAKSVLRELAPIQGIPDWVPPLTGEELDAVSEAWRESRSLRGLKRILEGVLKARDLSAARH